MYCIVIIAIVVLVVVIPLIIDFLITLVVNLFIIIIVYQKIDLITTSWGHQRALKLWGPGAFAPTAPLLVALFILLISY